MCKQSHQESVCLNAGSHCGPILEGLFRLIHQVENLLTRESSGSVVVGFVASLLKVNERCSDARNLRLKGLTRQTGAELWRNLVGRELLRHRLHICMTECPSQAMAEGDAIHTTPVTMRLVASCTKR